MDIKEALLGLDALDDDLWTADGMPKIDAVKSALGAPVTRKEIIDAHPGFTRESPDEGQDDIDDDPFDDLDEVFEEPVVITAIDQLKAERDALNFDIARVKSNIEDANNEINVWSARLAKVNNELTVIDPPMTNSERARNFINSSNEARLKRHNAGQSVIANLPLSAITTGTPLDQAYARRNKRGIGRPNR